jgi:UDP-N-acetylmuramate dehydrogenase
MEWQVEKNVPLSRFTTLRVGGPADSLVHPRTVEEALAVLSREGRVFTLGGGSNILVSDAGVRGVTMRISKCLSDVEFLSGPGNTALVKAQAGVSLARLSGLAMRRGLSGLEFAHGIPGTLGGALVMNAGTREGEMKDIAVSVTAVAQDGALHRRAGAQLGFSYRSSGFAGGDVIVECELALTHDDTTRIHERMRKGWEARKLSQPLDRPSAGSVFKNPAGDFAGRLIESAGLKGYSVGGAMVSVKHANFIVNTGGARASDVFSVIKEVERRVYDTSGVKLEREIRLVGQFDE